MKPDARLVAAAIPLALVALGVVLMLIAKFVEVIVWIGTHQW